MVQETGLHSYIGTDASVGATAGTFDNIDTVGSPQRLVDDATRYYGFIFSGSPVALTAAEAQSGRVRITSTDLDIVGEIWTYGAALGAGIATNNSQVFFPSLWTYLDVGAKGGEEITSAFTTYVPDPTDAWSTAIGQVHADKRPVPKEFFGFWSAGGAPPHQGGDGEDVTVSATTRTSVGLVTFEGKFSEAVGILPLQVQDPVGAAGEEAVGYLEVTSDIGGVSPMNIPLPSISPALGTPVGAPVAHTTQGWLPMYVKRDKPERRSFEPFVVLSTALTAANGFSYSVAYKQ